VGTIVPLQTESLDPDTQLDIRPFDPQIPTGMNLEVFVDAHPSRNELKKNNLDEEVLFFLILPPRSVIKTHGW
jgi:hypothetical protein